MRTNVRATLADGFVEVWDFPNWEVAESFAVKLLESVSLKVRNVEVCDDYTSYLIDGEG